MSIQELKTINLERNFASTVIDDLLSYPAKLNESEIKLINAKKRVDQIKEQIDIKRYSLLVSGVIDGKNSEIREAQIEEKISGDKKNLREAKENLDVEEANFHLLENEYQSLLAIARIVGNE